MMKRFILAMAFLLCFLPVGAGATDYAKYVKTGGSDEAAGDADESAWASISRVNTFINTLTVSDNATIYLNRGNTFTVTATLTIAKGLAVILEAYGTGDRPIIDGAFWGGTPTAGQASSAYSTFFDNYGIKVDSTAGTVTIRDIELKRVWGSGLLLNDSSVTVLRCYIHDTGSAGINTGYGTNSFVFEQNHISDTNLLWLDYITPGAGGWAQAINANNSSGVLPKFTSCRYNVIANSYGEAIGTAGSGSTVEHNVIINFGTVGIYVDPRSNNMTGVTRVRHNLIIGTQSTDFARTTVNGRLWCGDGVAVRDEVPLTGSNASGQVDIYGNVIAGCRAGVKLANLPSGTVYVHNNTLIDNGVNVEATNSVTYEYTEAKIFNNLSMNNYDTQVDHVKKSSALTNFTVGPNWWRGGSIEDAAFNHANDLTSDPSWPTVHPMSDDKGWTTLAAVTDVAFSDFYLNLQHANAIAPTIASGAEVLTTGTDFQVLPDTVTMVTQSQAELANYVFGATGAPPAEPEPDEETPVEAFVIGDSNDSGYSYGGTISKFGASKFTTVGAVTGVSRVKLLLHRLGAPNANMTARVYTDSSGVGSAHSIASDAIATLTISTSNSDVIFYFGTPFDLAGTTSYWLTWTFSVASDTGNRIYVHCDNDSGDLTLLRDDDGSGWTAYGSVSALATFYTTSGTAPSVAGIGTWNPSTSVCDTTTPEEATTAAGTLRYRCAKLFEQIITIANPQAATWPSDVGTYQYVGQLQDTGDSAYCLVFSRVSQGGDRDADEVMLQISQNDATFTDGDDNPADLSGSAGDLGTVSYSIPWPATNPARIGTFSGADDDGVAYEYFGAYATLTAAKAAFTILDGDHFTLGTVTEPGAMNLSGDDCTELAPCGITLTGDWTQAGAGLTMGDWWTISGAGNEISGAFTGGANNVIQRVNFK